MCAHIFFCYYNLNFRNRKFCPNFTPPYIVIPLFFLVDPKKNTLYYRARCLTYQKFNLILKFRWSISTAFFPVINTSNH